MMLSIETIEKRLWFIAGFLSLFHMVRAVLICTNLQRSRFLLNLWNLDQEAAFGTWFASMLLLAVGGSCYWLSQVSAAEARPWRLVSLLFVLLSIDEIAGVHEELGSFVHTLIVLPKWLLYAWVIPAGIIVALLTLCFARFVFSRRPETCGGLIKAALLYVGGAAGVELAGSALVTEMGKDSLPYLTTVAAEESFEMCGAILMLRTVMREIRALKPDGHLMTAR